MVSHTSFFPFWLDKTTWGQASVNTLWCLLGCSIGDMGVILFFQLTQIPFPLFGIIALAMLAGIATSILLETLILLSRHMPLPLAFKTAIAMSLLSMVAMELAMNVTDVAITGGARIVPSVIPWMLMAGFLAPLPYNYWRLKTYGKGCH